MHFHFPSLLLGVCFFIALALPVAILSARAAEKDSLFGQRRVLESDFFSLFSYAFTLAWFYALTGSFPVNYVAGGVGLYILTGIALWFAFRAAGLPSEKRVVQTTCLNTVFMKQHNVVGGCVMFLALMAVNAGFAFIAFQTAERADLTSRDGLFAVGLWVFTIPSTVYFVVGNLTRVVTLASAETPQQTRVQNFLASLRQYVLTAWTAGYPYFAFRKDIIEQNPRWMVLAMIAFGAAYLLLVALPYAIGRTRFIERSREVLERLDDAANRIVVATDSEVSETYRMHILDRVLGELQTLIRHVVSQRPFFQHYLNGVAGHTAALARGQVDSHAALSLPAPDDRTQTNRQAAQLSLAAANWDRIIKEYGSQMGDWDYRLYVITQIQEILDQPQDKGWLRGSALATRIAVSRWLNRHYARSVFLGSLGVAASAAFALALQAYNDELKIVAEAAASTIVTQVSVIEQLHL